MSDFQPVGKSETWYKLRFMFKKISMNPVFMEYWLTIPEFLDQIMLLYDKGLEIDDTSVLDIAERVYSSKKAIKDSGEQIDFDFRKARRGINNIRNAFMKKFLCSDDNV